MLKFLRRLLRWDSQPASSKPEGMERRQTPRTSAASVLADARPQAAEDPNAAEANESTEAATPDFSLQDPEMDLEQPNKDGSDPYDTGAYNRRNVWSNSGGRKN